MAGRVLSFGPSSASISSPSAGLGRLTHLFSASQSPGPLRTFVVGDSSFNPNHAAFSFPRLRRRSTPQATAVLSILPSAKPDRPGSGDGAPKWSARAIKSFCMAELEARKLKYPNNGTETLLMGILVEGTSLASKFLRENGVSLAKVREETIKLLGKSDMYFFSPEHPPLTDPAQRALDWAVDEKLKSGVEGEVTTTHLLLGIWSEVDSAGHKILASLGFNEEKASQLAKTADKDFELKYR
ncbi:ATP-dependent Clp protease ATP-binding subunit CLPT1, chloroplastic-like [Wolffia australiana]